MLFNCPATLAISFHDRIVDCMNRFNMPLQEYYYFWKVIGLLGIVIFGSRTFVQWIHSERHGESRVPVMFWWLSVAGTVFCLAYALRQKDSVFVLMYTFNMVPYVRNLMLIHRKRKEAVSESLEPSSSAASGSAG